MVAGKDCPSSGSIPKASYCFSFWPVHFCQNEGGLHPSLSNCLHTHASSLTLSSQVSHRFMVLWRAQILILSWTWLTVHLVGPGTILMTLASLSLSYCSIGKREHKTIFLEGDASAGGWEITGGSKLRVSSTLSFVSDTFSSASFSLSMNWDKTSLTENLC